jgi:hypothetical protein
MSKTRCSNRNEKKETRLTPWGKCSLKCLKLDDGVVDAAQWSSYPRCSGRTDDQCSWRAKTSETRYIEARAAGRGTIWRSGGSITRESFYNMEPHKAPET